MKLRTLTTLLTLVGATFTPFAAHATGVDEASGSGKGIVGGALLGGELVMVTEAAFKVKPAWAYVVGGVAGGAAGGVGGYFVEQNTDARAPMLMLAGGLVLAIPTLVAVLTATTYEPPANYVQDEAPTDEPLAEPPTPAAAPAAAPAPAADATPAGHQRTAPRYLARRAETATAHRLSLKLPPPALLGFQDARLALGVPNVELRHAYTRTEQLVFNAPSVTEVRIPVLDVQF
jgi:hypothetical protein